jgi:hypothetical protein
MTHDIVVRVALLERTGRSVAELRRVRAPNAAYARFTVDGKAWRLRDECVTV